MDAFRLQVHVASTAALDQEKPSADTGGLDGPQDIAPAYQDTFSDRDLGAPSPGSRRPMGSGCGSAGSPAALFVVALIATRTRPRR